MEGGEPGGRGYGWCSSTLDREAAKGRGQRAEGRGRGREWVRVDAGRSREWVRVDAGRGREWVRVDAGRGREWVRVDAGTHTLTHAHPPHTHTHMQKNIQSHTHI